MNWSDPHVYFAKLLNQASLLEMGWGDGIFCCNLGDEMLELGGLGFVGSFDKVQNINCVTVQSFETISNNKEDLASLLATSPGSSNVTNLIGVMQEECPSTPQN